MPAAALIYPPITDPTSGYHSLSYLDSYARQRGHAPAEIIDTNIEAFHHSYSAAGAAWLEGELARPRPDLDPATRAHLLRVADPDPAGVRRAVDVLRDGTRFYDYGEYQHAVDAVMAWMNCLGATGYPGQFRDGFRLQAPPGVAAGSVAALTDEAVLSRLSRPFQRYYDEILLPRLRRSNPGVVGINITYQWQLPFALWLIRIIRRALPDAFLVAGGTEVSDVYKHTRPARLLFELFDDLDAVVVGEGETAYADLLDGLDAGTLPVAHPNLRLHPRYGAVRPLPMLHYERLAELPTPDFSGLPWDEYLSPERFVYYSPSRGCYWNKCTFCDYGLNTDGPTSPWRQDTVDLMIRDVTELSKFAKFIYFSVDVLAPATILRFAEQVVERGLDLRWGAEIRLEKYWSDERCELLKRSGCTAISVGFESANQRILDLIDKGTTPEQVRRTIAAMTKAGIGVQMMGFTGFPTETVAEAMDTIRFLRDHRHLWTFGGLGEFVLTPGAIVAKRPERFGIANLRPLEGADIARVLQYDEPITEAAAAEVLAAKNEIYMGHYERPWVGATDTAHTFFYHDRFGVAVRERLEDDRSRHEEDEAVPFVVNGEFLARPDDETLRAYAEQYEVSERLLAPDRMLFRRADGRILLLPRRTKPFLDIFAGPATLAQARDHAWMVDARTADQLWDALIRRRLIRRCPAPVQPDGVNRSGRTASDSTAATAASTSAVGASTLVPPAARATPPRPAPAALAT
ncbi:B12-binding domain-containing radical SAM protein [Dactylosporangium sp. CA-092794]|uniref:B12-binding domain-containing radical SAM protein n=1 Tax=Dactylosporangium sp. CA-092794 TaxID=3239929 RepID=UPI003D8C79DA